MSRHVITSANVSCTLRVPFPGGTLSVGSQELGLGNEIVMSDICSKDYRVTLPRRGADLPAQGNALVRERTREDEFGPTGQRFSDGAMENGWPVGQMPFVSH
jgi:hypothetical protein